MFNRIVVAEECDATTAEIYYSSPVHKPLSAFK